MKIKMYFCSMKKHVMVKKTKSLFFATIFLLSTSLTAEAQMLIQQNGHVYVGQAPRPDDDRDSVLTMSLQGKYTAYNAGAKLGFGDMGRQHLNGWNVFVGEYGTEDSDMLWLHGKNGYKLTTMNAWESVRWKVEDHHVPHLTIYDNTRADRIAISSDDNHKQSVMPLEDAIGHLQALHGISYLYLPIKELDTPDGPGVEEPMTEKELDALTDVGLAAKVHNQGRMRYGFLAKEVEEAFPELVEVDEDGNQYVNYIELIPVLVNAINEISQQLPVEVRSMSVNGNSSASRSGNRTTQRHTDVGLDDDAVLYQNTPNPFSENTEIEYYVPSDATSAEIYVFSLNGLLLQTYPVSNFGHGTVIVSGSSLDAGMYVYALVVNGQIVDSKRMLLTR